MFDNGDGTLTHVNKDGIAVKYDTDGFPDFSPHAVHEVPVNMKPDYNRDYRAANEAAGIQRLPDGSFSNKAGVYLASS